MLTIQIAITTCPVVFPVIVHGLEGGRNHCAVLEPGEMRPLSSVHSLSIGALCGNSRQPPTTFRFRSFLTTGEARNVYFLRTCSRMFSIHAPVPVSHLCARFVPAGQQPRASPTNRCGLPTSTKSSQRAHFFISGLRRLPRPSLCLQVVCAKCGRAAMGDRPLIT